MFTHPKDDMRAINSRSNKNESTDLRLCDFSLVMKPIIVDRDFIRKNSIGRDVAVIVVDMKS